MNNTYEDAIVLIDDLTDMLGPKGIKNVEVILCPPALYLELATDFAEGDEEENTFPAAFSIGAQNVSDKESGAYTGEISAPMLASMDVSYCIIGHSERRQYFGETDAKLAVKAKLLIDNGVKPIFCCGEVLAERESGKHFDVVSAQLEEALFGLSKEEILEVVIAYEPVWAIGTGKTATAAQAQEMHAYIREFILGQFGAEVANDITILYGGSCKPSNAKELFSQPDVDGGLIGGASLNAEDFVAIAKSF